MACHMDIRAVYESDNGFQPNTLGRCCGDKLVRQSHSAVSRSVRQAFGVTR